MIIKDLLKKILNKEQRRSLCLCHQRWMARGDIFWSRVVNIFPVGLRVFLKAHIQVRRRMDHPRLSIFIDVSSAMENDVRTRSCSKEPETVAWIETFRAGDVFWDIGANVGAYALVAAKQHEGRVKVYAVEPSVLNFAQLCRNIALNHCGEIITPLNIALSDKTAVGKFHYHNWVAGGAMHAFGAAVGCDQAAFQPVFSQDILSYSLDDVVAAFGLAMPDHIKIDVDGLEPEIMNGARRILSDKKKVRSLLVEIAEKDAPLVAFLGDCGFQMAEKHLQGHGDSKLYNCIFTRGN
ncbi:MAG: FkbM family methyltransferase [Candidatus Omnitrophica bacterium]|nr:FkbM family methyltransferase [Candidatus Omnitrophota bacterium]